MPSGWGGSAAVTGERFGLGSNVLVYLVDGLHRRYGGSDRRRDDLRTRRPSPLRRAGRHDCNLITDPIIVVEVLSRSNRRQDTDGKLEDYFRLPPVRHYLSVKTANRTVIQHHREVDDRVQTRIVREGTIDLDPPGLSVEVGKLFP